MAASSSQSSSVGLFDQSVDENVPKSMVELDAPGAGEPECEKYLTTFPFPYMNGKLHLGHTFTLTKCEFAVGYQRLKGKRALFPFAFHATGMPISACSNKLKIEQQNGVPETLRQLKAQQPEFSARASAAEATVGPMVDAFKAYVAAHPKDMGARHLAKTVLDRRSEAANKAAKAADPHSTGGVIRAAAERCEDIQAEMAAIVGGLSTSSASSSTSASTAVTGVKEKGGRGKEKAKKVDAVWQWEIMQMLGLPEAEIPEFTDAVHWLKYFPPRAIDDLRRLGVKVDWRRAFLTTDQNPYYDSFIRWHFNTLHAQQDKLAFGTRYTIWSPTDNQPCMDHDRASGEGIKPTEYTAVKLKLAGLRAADDAGAHPLGAFFGGDKQVFLIAATMRPETMVGQTNCWVGPDIEYGIFATPNPNDVFVMSDRSAYNLSFQSDPQHGLVYTAEFGKVQKLGSVTGRQLIGCTLSAPRTVYEKVWVLPMMTVLPDVGTGIVTSVPSDAPADYAAFMDLQRKPDFRALFGVESEWLLAPVPIITIPELGDTCAIKVVEDMSITGQNDPRLSEAKDLCYRRGFAQGVMLTGEVKGQPVSVSKDLARQSMIAAGEAFPYAEPSGPVISRSGA